MPLTEGDQTNNVGLQELHVTGFSLNPIIRHFEALCSDPQNYQPGFISIANVTHDPHFENPAVFFFIKKKKDKHCFHVYSIINISKTMNQQQHMQC